MKYQQFVSHVAALKMDGEAQVDDEPFVLENDDAVETLHSLIGWARDLIGYEE